MYSFSVFLEPISTGLEVTERTASLLFSVNQFMLYFFAAVLGVYVDQKNIRPLLLFGALCSVGGVVGTGLASTYPSVFFFIVLYWLLVLERCM